MIRDRRSSEWRTWGGRRSGTGSGFARSSVITTRRWVALGLVLTALATVGLGLLAEKNPDARASGQDRTIVIQDGDTLWGIAERFASPDIDRRQWIFQVRRMNHLEDATIYPGMVLRIPAGN